MTIFKDIIGRVDEDSSFISLEIEGGYNNDSIGDQVWISPNGKIMDIYESIDMETIEEARGLFEGTSRQAFIGAFNEVELFEVDEWEYCQLKATYNKL